MAEQLTRIGRFDAVIHNVGVGYRELPLRGRGAPQNGLSLLGPQRPGRQKEALNPPVVAPVMCLFGSGGICFFVNPFK